MFQEWIGPQRRASANLMFLAVLLNDCYDQQCQ